MSILASRASYTTKVNCSNGLIRQYFPKKTSFADITADQIAFVQNRLNTRPRKNLNYKQPDVVYFSNTA
jgi:IS30 family transposase